jgi:ElaB/YqjD/DUF883 family membrane-anchored ribosome-binding protein
MYISFDDGANWKPFQLNMPVVPITDMTIKENDLIVATQGRGFYVLDDLTVLQQVKADVANKNLHVFDVNPGWRMPMSRFSRRFGTAQNIGENPAGPLVITFFAKDVTDSTKASITIMDKNKKTIKTFSTDGKDKLDIKKGLNKFAWDLQYPPAEPSEGMILWNGAPGTITAAPGTYFAKVKVGSDSSEVPFTIKADPNYRMTQEAYEEQFNFLLSVQQKFNDVQKGIKDIRALRTQINDFIGRQGKDCPKEIKDMATAITKELTSIEETLYQTKSKSGQDPLNYPIRINDKLSGVFDVANSGVNAPSKQSKEVFAELSKQADEQLNKLKKIVSEDVPKFNQLIREKSLPVIGIK